MLNGQSCDPIQTIWVGKGYSYKVTPKRELEYTGVTALKVDPLSVDLTIFPALPTTTNTPEPDEEELSELLLELSEEVMNPIYVSYWLLKVFPAMSLTPVVSLILYVVA